MSVLIKGMEMPTDNTVLLRIFPTSENGECYTQQIDIDGDILTELWAVPVPPHGDLIDRGAFVAAQRHLYCENCDRRRGMKDGKLTKRFVYAIGDVPCRACDIGDVLDSLEDYAPTIIPADPAEEKTE